MTTEGSENRKTSQLEKAKNREKVKKGVYRFNKKCEESGWSDRRAGGGGMRGSGGGGPGGV